MQTTVTEPLTTMVFLDEIHPTEAIQRIGPKIIIRPTVNVTESTTEFPDYPPLEYDDTINDIYSSVYESHLNSSFLQKMVKTHKKLQQVFINLSILVMAPLLTLP